MGWRESALRIRRSSVPRRTSLDVELGRGGMAGRTGEGGVGFRHEDTGRIVESQQYVHTAASADGFVGPPR
jgi:hypothetical protein